MLLVQWRLAKGIAAAVFCLGVASKGHAATALTGFATATDQHWAFVDTNGHIRQIIYTYSSNSFSSQDITAAANAPAAAPGSALTSFATSVDQHWGYEDGNGHIWQIIFVPSSNAYSSQDVTAAANAPIAANGSGLTAFESSGDQHWAFYDASGQIWQIVFTYGTNTFGYEDLTSLERASNGPGERVPYAGLGNGLSSFATSSDQHWTFQGNTGGIYEIVFTNSTNTVSELLLSGGCCLAHVPPPVSGAAVSSFAASGAEHWMWADSYGHIWQLVWTAATGWGSMDLTAAADAPVAAMGSPLTSFATPTDQHWAFNDEKGHIWQIVFTYSSGRFSVQDLTAAANGPPPAISFPSGLIPFTSIYYITAPDANGNRLVVGKSTISAWQAVCASSSSSGNEFYSDASIQLAPGQLFQKVYVPTEEECAGDFSDFGGVLIDPETNHPFPNNEIPASRLPDPFAFRIGPPSPLLFVPVTPCRVADTRNPAGPFGGPELAGGESREFVIPNSACGIPSNAAAYSLNVTVVPNGELGFLSVWPSGYSQPVVSTLNSDGRVKANAAIVPAGSDGGIDVYASDPTHVVLDIDGYFAPPGSSTLAFYPVPPCRIADTRNSPGALGGPSLVGGTPRDFPILSSTCAIPSTAAAYSLNFTAVPHGPLWFLSTWPSGQPQPFVSTLNSDTGAVTANAAIVPAGSNGDIFVFATNDSDLVIDINGYFAPPGAGGLSLYTVTPCRVLDTRNSSGAFSGVLTVNVTGSDCGTLASAAQGFVLNATVVPESPLGFLTLWPDGDPQPYVSTLNASDEAITSNMAIMPTINGSIDAYASSLRQLILDISGFFAP